MKQETGFYLKVAATVALAIVLFVVIVVAGTFLGIEGVENRTFLVVGGLVASLFFGAFVWKSLLSAIGLIFFFVTFWASDYVGLGENETIIISVVACLVAAFLIAFISKKKY